MTNRNTFLRIANAVLVTALMFLPMGMAAQASAAIARDALNFATCNGNRTVMTDARGKVTHYEYDALNRLVKTTFPDQKTATVVWRADGRKQSESDQNGNTIAYGYDAMGRLNLVTQTAAATNQATIYGFDEAGNKIGQTDAEGRVTHWEYDANNRVAARVLPNGQRESFTYDALGNVLSHTDFAGKTSQYAYNSLNQPIQTRRPDGALIVIAYTPNGLIDSISVTAGVGSGLQNGKTQYRYDAQDRLTRQSNPDNGFLAWGYDKEGNIVQRSTPAGTVSYTYDGNNRLSGVIDSTGATAYHYNPSGQADVVSLPNGTVANDRYDDNGRLTGILHLKGSAIVSGVSYTLADNGQRINALEYDSQSVLVSGSPTNPAITRNYQYDGVGRLQQEQVIDRSNAAIRTTGYLYDRVGNRSQKIETTAGGTTITNYAYDANDRLTQESRTVGGGSPVITAYTWDGNGNLSSKAIGTLVTVYGWDAQNRLVQVSQGASQATATVIAQFVYDSNGNRVQKIEPGASGQPDKVTAYLVDETFPYAQTVQETETLGSQTTSTRYVWGNSLIEQVRGGQGAFYHPDGLGSVKALTDANGNLTDTYQYEAFGNVEARTGTTTNAYRFTGEYADDTIALQYNRARWYDASVGRFVSLDPINGRAIQPVSLNKYLYVGADPVNGRDPSGLTTLAELSVTEDAEAELNAISLNTGKEITKKVGCEMVEWAAGEAITYGIYILSDGLGYYVGQSIDIERRLAEHARSESKRLFQVISRVAVPMLPGQAGKNLLSIAEQAVMDALKEEGRSLTNARRQIASNGRLSKALEAIKGICK